MSPLLRYSLLLILLALHTGLTLSSSCVHDEIETDIQSIKLLSTQKQGRMLATYQSLRVVFDFSNLDIPDKSLYDYIVNELIPPAKNYLSATLKVPQSSEKLVLTGLTTTCRGAINVPTILQTTGVDADLLIFVTAKAEVGVSYVAYSSICLIDTDTNRPVGGRLHFNTNVIQQKNKESQREADLVTTMHEITHILGFSSSVYSNYIDPATNKKLTGHLFNITVNGMTVPVLNLRPVTSRLQSYFNCDTLKGAYLENEGAAGSFGSHLERRLFFNEYMTASRLNDARITEFTLAILEGSGWYQVDYSMAEAMTWGKGKGCSFVNGGCIDTSATPRVAKFEEFCSPLLERGCSWTGREGAMCGNFLVQTASSVSAGINWWSNDTISRDPYSDNCPLYQAFSNTDCEDVENIASAKLSGSSSGYGSKCFMGTLSNSGAARPFGSYCFKASCENYGSGKKRVNVQVGGVTGVCESEGDIDIAGVAGVLSCPDPVKFCKVIENEGFCRRECMARGSCVNKECQCQPGWGSMDCGKRVYTECEKCKGDSSKPSCYGDTCACSPADTRCNGGGLTVVEIVGIAIGAAAFVILLILVIRYRKAIMARLKRKRTLSPQPRRFQIASSPGSDLTSPDQRKELVSAEETQPAPSLIGKHVNIDFNSAKIESNSVQYSPEKGLGVQFDSFMSPGENSIPVQEPVDDRVNKEWELRPLG